MCSSLIDTSADEVNEVSSATATDIIFWLGLMLILMMAVGKWYLTFTNSRHDKKAKVSETLIINK